MKLAAARPDLEKVERALLDMAAGSGCSRASLTTTYHDTADLTLQKQGLTLRVREADGHFVQTVKAEGEPGGLARGEWEDEIAGAEPNVQAPHSGGRLPPGIADHLQPLFASAVTRRMIALEPSPSLRIEAAIDEGEIRGIAGGGTTPISEVELELKHGEPAALFDTALELLAAAPLHIETRSKAERGYAALAGAAAPPHPANAAPIALEPAMPAERALQAIGRACLSHLLHNEPAALAGDAEGVHQMRVASRRLGAAAAGFGKLLPRAERRWLKRELDRFDEVLGAARNLDVFATDLLAACHAALPGEPALDHLAAAVGQARDAAYQRVRDVILSPPYTAAVLRLLRWFEARGWRGASAPHFDRLDTPIGEVAPRLLDRRYREMRRRGKGFRRATKKERHKLRIALKELRYAGELLASLFDPQQARSFGKPLKALQDVLGYANDVRVARDVVAELAAQAADESDQGSRRVGDRLAHASGSLL